MPNGPRVRRLLVCLLLTALAGASAAAAEVDPAEYELAISTILCDCGCHPQSVKACACGRAAEMRREIHDQMAGVAGPPLPTGEELIAHYVAQHGEQIRIAPTARGFNLVAWVGPFVALFLACVGMLFLLRRWRSAPGGEILEAPVAGPLPDESYLRRLQEKLEERR